MTTIYLVRHGETDWNRERRIQGSTDIPLNQTGRDQAAVTGALLATRQWDGVYASPLSRAYETGAIIAGQLGLPAPEAVPEVAERRYGEAEGLTGDEIDARFPGDTPVPGRESREDVAARVIPAIVALAERHPGENIVLVSHGGVIRTILTVVAPDEHPESIRNGSVHSFRHTDGTLDLIAFDDPIEEQSLACATDDIEDQNAVESRDSLV
ncbi:histidine phosphatase family protein [Conyzicola sp.]|uniref:histidine phosphatase family protein n=1 Tax=Conyzicola sp. TaxID=1969404 RepID=UPI0039895407